MRKLQGHSKRGTTFWYRVGSFEMSEHAAQKDLLNHEIACRWCTQRGVGWSVTNQAGRGGTAPVFEVDSPEGIRALKIYDEEYSIGAEGKVQSERVRQQVTLGVHDCPSLVKIYDGGAFEDRLFLLMNRAPGQELEKQLGVIPRNKIRGIVDQIARACKFLRERNLCHRDIKAANIFISDDFEIATLLDLSVTRDIYDPVGIGTDHDGQLPVVATARYSPPEYLFRLLEPGLELWHALDIYQLGALLHDLIMRAPLFFEEYAKSKENRYRFAWAVATVDPIVHATDVDQDLIFTARRALDKDWERRSRLTLNDFLADAETQQTRALDALGVSTRLEGRLPYGDRAALLTRINEVTSALEARILEHLRRQNVTPHHFVEPLPSDLSKEIRFEWVAPKGRDITGSIKLVFRLALNTSAAGRVFQTSATLGACVAGISREEVIELPTVEDSAGANDRLGEQAEAVIGPLASALLRRPHVEG